MITAAHLTTIVPSMSASKANQFAPYLQKYMAKYAINTPNRISYFMAQVLEETGGLTATSENGNYSAKRLQQVSTEFGGKWKSFTNPSMAAAYAGQPEKLLSYVYSDRYGNGSPASGDGWRYRGRGLMQLTWKGNYIEASQSIYGDNRLVTNPDQVANNPEVSVAVACWFWNHHKCNQLADKNNFTAAVKKVNGGTVNMDKRLHFLQKVQDALSSKIKKKVVEEKPKKTP